jgi:hypothetical protein
MQPSASNGDKGTYRYDWGWLPLADRIESPWRRWLLVRQGIISPTVLAVSIICVAGTGWVIESCFEAAKGEMGLDHYEVRSWRGWCRHITPAMWGLVLLAFLRAWSMMVER